MNHWIISAGFLLVGSAAFAQSSITPAMLKEAGPVPPHAIRMIVEKLRAKLRDPESLRLEVCTPKLLPPSPAMKVGDLAMDASPARWTVFFAANSKNGYGGYTGRTYGSVLFSGGKMGELGFHESDGSFVTTDIQSALADRFAECQKVAKAYVDREMHAAE